MEDKLAHAAQSRKVERARPHSHVRLDAKRNALDALTMGRGKEGNSDRTSKGYDTNNGTKCRLLGTVQNNISALRFLHKRTLKRRDLAFDDLPFPKQPRTLPTVLSQDEVTRLIEAAANRKHRMLLMLLYATGMRRTPVAFAGSGR